MVFAAPLSAKVRRCGGGLLVTLAGLPSQSKPVGFARFPLLSLTRHLPPARGKSFLKVGALGSPRKLHLFAKASPFGRGGCERSEQPERARMLSVLRHRFYSSSTSYMSVWNTKGSCFSQLASLWVPPGTMRLVRWMPRVRILLHMSAKPRRIPSWLPISREP